MFRSLTFKTRITWLVVAAMLAVLLVIAAAMVTNARQITEARRALLVSTLDSAHSIVAAFQAQAKAGKLDTAQAQAAAVAALRGSRYGKDDYFYIWTLEGVSVLHPLKPEWEGQPKIGQIPDGQGGDVLKSMIDGLKAAPSGQAFVETFFPRPGQIERVLKLQYLRRYRIGTG